MTTCTPVFGLPCQEGSDRPCDLSEVWCEFAQAIDATLFEFDQSLGVTAVTVPFAHVQLSERLTFQDAETPAELFWESVAADTDNMVNLEVDDRTVFITRPGIWVIHAVVQVFITDAPANQNAILSNSLSPTYLDQARRWYDDLSPGPAGFPTGDDETSSNAGFQLVSDHTLLVTQANIDATGLPQVRISVDHANNELQVEQAQLTVRWMAEDPT